MPAMSRTGLRTPSTAHQVARGYPVRPVGATHVGGHRRVVLAQVDNFVPTSYAGTEFGGDLLE